MTLALAGLASGCGRRVAFPLKASTNKRYLVDQKNVPFLMVGDAPQAMMGNLSEQEATTFILNRAQYGVNTLWINLLCDSYTACNSDGPLTASRRPRSPTPIPPTSIAAKILDVAARYGMVVLLDPIETGGWLGILQANGTAKAFAYGQFLGKRFKDSRNIIWMSGNDFQSWGDAGADEVVSGVAKGIQNTDPKHIHTAELSYLVSATRDDPTWEPIIALGAVYTYRPTYAKILSEYSRNPPMPMFMVEANYEFEQNGGTDGGSTQNLRKQEYWTALSGTTGQLYASAYSWRLQGDWAQNLNTVGILQFYFVKRLFETRKWYDLAPDQAHQVLTSGYGTFSEDDSINTDDYVTAARATDGSLVMAYLPSIRKVTIDMTKLSGAATARWFDPTNAAFINISGSPFVNTGSRGFTPPGNNHDGDGDWVLLLEVK